jgi:hypothetical protein
VIGVAIFSATDMLWSAGQRIEDEARRAMVTLVEIEQPQHRTSARVR